MRVFFFFFSLVVASRAYSLVVVHGFLITVASLVAELGLKGSAVAVYGVSCSTAYRIFQAQGSNLCPLHWQVDSYPPGPGRSHMLRGS